MPILSTKFSQKNVILVLTFTYLCDIIITETRTNQIQKGTDMKKYECAEIGNYNTRLLIESKKEYKIGDIYVGEYKDENHHFIYGRYIIIAER